MLSQLALRRLRVYNFSMGLACEARRRPPEAGARWTPGSMGLNDPEKPCMICGTPMPAMAKYCKACNHYQSFWSRTATKLDVSSVIAVLSTTTIAASFLHTNVFTPTNKITASVLACDNENFHIVFDNNGRESIIIQNLIAYRYLSNAQSSTESDKIEFKMLSPEKVNDSAARDIVIRPSAYAIADVKTKPDDFSDVSPTGGQTYHYRVTYVSSTVGGADSKSGETRCPSDG